MLALTDVSVLVASIDGRRQLAAAGVSAVHRGVRGMVYVAQARARAESLRDPLTGLANRRALVDHFRRFTAGRRASDSLGLLPIDLDHFKQVNTRHGLGGGDRALIIVAGALRDAVREGIRLGASAGAALFPEDGSTPEELFSAADMALTAAKNDGKGRLVLAA